MLVVVRTGICDINQNFPNVYYFLENDALRVVSKFLFSCYNFNLRLVIILSYVL